MYDMHHNNKEEKFKGVHSTFLIIESDGAALNMCTIHQNHTFSIRESDVAALNVLQNSKHPHNP